MRVTDKDVWMLRVACSDPSEDDSEVRRIAEEIVERERKPILEALVLCAIPYEAILMDAGSKKWIEPGIWESMGKAVESARREVHEEVGGER